MKTILKKLFSLTRRYDVPVDHTWSKRSIEKHRTEPVSQAEIDAVIQKAEDFIVSKPVRTAQ